MSLADHRQGRILTPSERDWLEVREYLQGHRHELGRAAAEEYPDIPKVHDTPLLTRPSWLPVNPVPLDAVDLEFTPDAPFTGLTGTEPVTQTVRPERVDGSRYPSYAAAMAELAASPQTCSPLWSSTPPSSTSSSPISSKAMPRADLSA